MPDIADAIARDFELTEAEQEELLPSGRQRLFYNRLAWGKFHMIKAGLLESPSRGRFIASSAGRKLLASNPTAINVELLRTFPPYTQFIASTVDATPVESVATEVAAVSSATPEEQIGAAQRAAAGHRTYVDLKMRRN